MRATSGSTLSLLVRLALVAPVFSPVGAGQDLPVSAPDGSERGEVARGFEGLTPALDHALVRVLSVEAEIERLTRPVDEQGQPITDPKLYQELLLGPDRPFLAYMHPALERFDLHGQELPSLRFGADLVLFDAGFQAAQALTAGVGSLEPAQLLGLFSDRFVHADPIWGTAEAREYQLASVRAGQLAPLGNGGALGFLAWGLLYQDSFWESESNDRQQFILELLVRGFDSRLVARSVTRALAAPMVPPRSEWSSTRPGRGIAGPLASLRGKVGFTKVHEARLVADLASVEALERLPSSSKDQDLRGHLKTWLPEMLALVRQELYPASAAVRMRHGGTLMERLTYWDQLFGQFGFVEGREKFLLEVEAIMAGADAHPLSARIEQLLAMQAAGSLHPDQLVELQSLQSKRGKDRDELLLKVTSMMVRAGLRGHYDMLVETLLSDLPSAFGEMPAYHQEVFLSRAWGSAVNWPQPRTMQTLEDHFAGAARLPSYAVEYLVAGLTVHEYPGGTELLHSIVEAGAPINVARAIANSGWLSDAGMDRAATRLIDALAAPGDAAERSRLTAGLLSALGTRQNKQQVKAILTETFESGLWTDPSNSWVRYIDEQQKQWIRGQFSSDELAEFESRGQLHPGGLR